jgi:hypothetical protein
MENLYDVNLGLVSSTENCDPVVLADHKDLIEFCFLVEQSGSLMVRSDPESAELNLNFTNIGCGSGAVIYLKNINEFSKLENLINTDYSVDSNLRFLLNYPTQIEPRSINTIVSSAGGIYELTSEFKDDKPVYKNKDNWKIHFNKSLRKWYITHPVNKVIFCNCSEDIFQSYALCNEQKIIARWDADYLRSDGVVEELYSKFNFKVNSTFILNLDESENKYGKVFNFQYSKRQKNLGNILNSTFSSNNFTISVWTNPKSIYSLENSECCFRTTGNGECDDMNNCKMGAILSKSSSYQVLDNDSFIVWADGSLSNSKERVFIPQSKLNVNTGNWNHLVYVVEDGLLKIYHNAELVKTSNLQNNYFSSNDDLVIGNIQLTNSEGDSSYWGLMDDIRIYEKPLSPYEISQIYDGTDSISDLEPFSIPLAEDVETNLPISEDVRVFNNILKSNAIKKLSDDRILSLDVDETGNLKLVYYILVQSGLAISSEETIGNFPSFKDFIVDFDYIDSPNNQNILLIWLSTNDFYIFEKDNSEWKSQNISSGYEYGKSKFQFSTKDSRQINSLVSSYDILFILSKNDLLLYRKNFAGLWSIFKVFENIKNFSLKDDLLLLLESDPSAFDSYDILLYRIGETIKLEDADTYYGSFDSTTFGFTQVEFNEDHFLLASFSNSYSEKFKFDPNDNYLSKASPSIIEVYRIDKTTEGYSIRKIKNNENEIIPSITPPYRKSGLKYSNIVSFGKKISFGGKYLAVSSDNANFVYLFEYMGEDSFEFVTHLVLPTNSPTPTCLVTDDYCVVHHGSYKTDQNNLTDVSLFHFDSKTDLQRVHDSFDDIETEMEAWWDFGKEYGKLSEKSHIIFDKSGKYNHLGATIGYDTITTDITGAFNDDPIYDISKISDLDLQTPLDKKIFLDNFSIFIWFKNIEMNKIPIFRISDNSEISNNENNEFVIYSNGDVKYGSGYLFAQETSSKNDWVCLAVIKSKTIDDGLETSKIEVFKNNYLISSKKNVNGSFLENILNMVQIFPVSAQILVDDIRIYNYDVNESTRINEFKRSFRYFILNDNVCR